MSDIAYKLKVLRQIGLLRVQAPHRLLKAGLKLATWGPGFPSGVGAAAARFPKQTAIIDDAGELTWAELQAEINRTTAGLKARGVGAGDAVALMCRNHRHMVVAMVSVMQLGGKALLLNTMASASQLGELTRREGAELAIVDQEFSDVTAEIERDKVVIAWADDDSHGLPTLAELAHGRPSDDHPKPERPGGIVIFTSGTTGLPKGAKRKEPENLDPLLTFFGSIPYRGNSTVVLAAPLFHSWGLINFGFGLSSAPTFVLRRRFDAEQVIADVAEHRAEVLVVVPLMMQRMVNADPDVIARHDVSSLRITATSGSALAGELATHFMDTFTDSVYNFYGATETGWVTIASPQDLRAAPGTAGRIPWRTVVKVLDDDGQELPPGETGVIHVGNEMQFGGYTDGNTKDFRDGLMHTGDLGWFDEEGRLFVAGRDDDMVICGGENVFPRELEDALIEHPDITDVAVQGVPDPDWGQCLAAYVVVKDGAELSEDDVVAYAKGKVARFAVPRRLRFLDELPRNPTGKVMRRELPDFDD